MATRREKEFLTAEVDGAGYVRFGQSRKRVIDELRERNSDLSYMAGERDILLAAIQEIAEYDDGTKWINSECGSMALKALEDLEALRAAKASLKT